MLDYLLRNIEGKLARAEEHLRRLEEIIESGAVADLVETRTDRDRQWRVRVRVKEIAEIPVDWNVLVGECVYNMRSALDHLAYGLNIIGSGEDPPPNHRASQFPIYSDRSSYRGKGRARPASDLIEHFPRGARARVESVQPYHGRKGDPVGPRSLEILAALSNIDKHRRFPIAAASALGFMVPRAIEGKPVVDVKAWYRLLKPDATVLRFDVPRLSIYTKEPNVDFRLAADIHLVGARGEPPISLGEPSEPITLILDSALSFIQREVLPPLLPFILGEH